MLLCDGLIIHWKVSGSIQKLQDSCSWADGVDTSGCLVDGVKQMRSVHETHDSLLLRHHLRDLHAQSLECDDAGFARPIHLQADS